MTADQIIAEVIGKACSDREYRAALLADPASVLSDAGVDIPDGQSVSVLEDTPTLRYLVVPADLTDEVKHHLFSALAEALPLPVGQHVDLCQNSDRHRYLVLPRDPAAEGDLRDEDLGMVVGGVSSQSIVPLPPLPPFPPFPG